MARAASTDATSAPAAEASRARGALATLLGQLTGPDRNVRRAAARSIESLGGEAVSAMADELAALRPGRPVPELVAVLAGLHRGREPETSDRLDSLLDAGPAGSDGAYAQATITLCLLRALAHVGTPEAVATFAPVALDSRGTFAPEVRAYLTQLGERATAGLILVAHSRSRALEKWAAAELEGRGTRTPGDAVQTKSKEVLASVLTAYGAVRDPDALSVVLSFVNADRRVVRDAARDAVAGYGDEAVPKLRETYGLLSGEAPPSDWPTPWLRRKLFDALDRVRLEDVDARVQSGLALTREGRFADAVASFDDVLARQPDWDRKAELVPAYVFRAQELSATDRTAARELFERALHLDPDGLRSPQIRSALALLDGLDLEARGIVDPVPFRRALELDPTNVTAAGALLRFEDDAHRRQSLWKRRFAIAGASLAALSAGILLVGVRRRRPALRERRVGTQRK